MHLVARIGVVTAAMTAVALFTVGVVLPALHPNGVAKNGVAPAGHSLVLREDGELVLTYEGTHDPTSHLRMVNAVRTSTRASGLVLINSPTAASTVPAGTSFLISFNTSSFQSSYAYVYYNMVNSSSLSSIGSTVYVGNVVASTSWVVPPTLVPGMYQIQIFDSQNPSIYGLSDMFSVTNTGSGTFSTYTPVANSAYSVGSSVSIYFSTSSYSYAWISYRASTSQMWTSIVSSLYCPGSTNTYSWSLPTSLSPGLYQIQICSTSSCSTSSAYSYSGLFTVTAGSVAVSTSVGSGGFIGLSSSLTISWSGSSFSSSYLSVSYQPAGGAQTIIATSVYVYTGSYTWSVPSSLTPGQYQIKLTDSSYSSVYGWSSLFYVGSSGSGSISITAPVYTSVWNPGMTYPIMFSTATISSSYATISYKSPSSLSWSQITSSTYIGSLSTFAYYWTVPSALSSGTYQIQVCDANSCTSASGTSQSFMVGSSSSSSVTVTAPTSSSLWTLGSTYSIVWNTGVFTSSYATIYYAPTGTTSWTTVVSYTSASAGSYSWTVPTSLTPGNYQIKICDYSSCSSIYGFSASFSIVSGSSGSISITSPTSTSAWTSGQSYYIYYSTSQFTSSSTVQISYRLSGSSYWTSITTSASPTSGYYYWSISSSMASGAYQIQVCNYYSCSSTYGTSAAFTISGSSGLVSITAPSSSSYWYTSTYYSIVYSTSQFTSSSTVQISYRLSGSSYWTSITTSASPTTGTYSWYLSSSLSSGTYQIQVCDYYACSSTYGVSASFTISGSSGSVSVSTSSSVNAGDSLYISYSTSQITSSYVNIYYQSLSDSYWTTITSYSYANGYYYWYVPTYLSGSYRVKVCDASNCATQFGTSDYFWVSSYYYYSATLNGGWIAMIVILSILFVSCVVCIQYRRRQAARAALAGIIANSAYARLPGNANQVPKMNSNAYQPLSNPPNYNPPMITPSAPPPYNAGYSVMPVQPQTVIGAPMYVPPAYGTGVSAMPPAYSALPPPAGGNVSIVYGQPSGELNMQPSN